MGRSIFRFFTVCTALAISYDSAAIQAANPAHVVLTVVDESGHPVDGAEATLTTPSMKSFRSALKTNAKGKIEVVLIEPAWSYNIEIAKTGFLPTQTSISVPAGRTQNLSLTLRPPAGAAAAPDPSSPEGLVASGRVAFIAGDYRGAAQSFARAIEEKREFPEPYYWMAMCEFNLKKIDQARATFQRYLDLAPAGEHASDAREMLKSIPSGH